MEIDLENVKRLLREGNRVLLMMRHSERPHIDHEDPTFGAHLPITPRGERMSEWVGAQLKDFASDVQFLASPLRRTRMTAAFVAKGMGLPDVEIPTAELLGNSTFYFADQPAVFNLFRDGSFYEKVFAYIEKGTQIGFNEIHQASDDLEAWVLAQFTGKLGIFTTHDLYNGAFLAAKGVVKSFTIETWIQFLDSAAIIIAPDGTRRYALVRSHAETAVPNK